MADDGNGIRAEVRQHDREIERLREKAHSNANFITKHESRLEVLEDALNARSDNLWKFVAIAVAVTSPLLSAAAAAIMH